MSRIIRTILPPAMAFAGGPVETAQAPLFDAERAFLARSAPKRVAQFTAGRFYARRALAQLNHPMRPILIKSNRAPDWPAGAVGSISHCNKYCCAAVANSAHISALGLDVEDERVPAALADTICDSSELETALHDCFVPALALTTIFSIKESVFKAYAPINDSFLDFRDVTIILDWQRGEFRAKLIAPGRPALFGRKDICGRFALVPGLVFSCSFVPADGRAR